MSVLKKEIITFDIIFNKNIWKGVKISIIINIVKYAKKWIIIKVIKKAISLPIKNLAYITIIILHNLISNT